jgi:hypothetical protein
VTEDGRDLARKGPTTLDRARALDHIAVCLRCQARLGLERALDARLAALAKADAGAEAPPRLEAALRDELRRNAMTPRTPEGSGVRISDRRSALARMGRWRFSGADLRWAGAAALAVAAVIIAVVTLRPQPPPPPRARETRDFEGHAYQASGAPFLPIGDGERLREVRNPAVVRMRVPGVLPVLFGWPLPPTDDRPRTADVLFGEDGVARGIRFLPTSFEAGR